MMKYFVSILFITIILPCQITLAQLQKEDPVFLELKKADSLIFDQGFNKCNFEILQKIMHKDLQFLHDQNGIQNREEFFKVFKESICSNADAKPIRKLLHESLEVYPLKNEGVIYGAVQMGMHEFFIAEPNKEPRFTVNGKFIHTWLLEDGQWKLYRVVSYDHQQPKKYGPKFDANYSSPLFNKDSEIEVLLQKHNIPSLSVGYINNGKLQQVRSFGQQKPNVPIGINSIYKVASLTKPITALVALKLVDAGKWNLDNPIYNYYIDPDVKDHPFVKKLTTRQILSHQSGLPNWRYLREDQNLVFEFEPGTKFQYSGEGYEWLRKALEKKFNKSLQQLANELIFKPLNMSDTHYFWTPAMDERRYAVESDTLGKPIDYEKYITSNAAANLLTTVEDYGQFLVHIMRGAGLSPKLYNDFISPYSTMKDGIKWGLGMQIFPELPNGKYALVHTGGDFGTKCIVILLPQSKKGLLIFSNSENGMVVWRKIIEEYLGETGKEIVRRNLE